MANVQKYTAAAAGHLVAHYERRMVRDPQSGKMEYIKFGNQDIDPSRSHLNYNLAPHRDGGQIAFIRQRTTEARTLKRDDVNVMCSWVVTLPRTDEYGEERSYTEHEIMGFFREAYRTLADRYGEKNVVSAYVHMDETTPHMHFAFVPVIEDKKRGGEKVSAKDVLTRQDLKTLHVDLQKRMDERFGDGFFPVLNGNTVGGNRTIAELKIEKAASDLSVIDTELFRTQQKLDETKEAIEQAERKLRDQNAAADRHLEGKRQELQKAYEGLERVKSDIVALNGEKTALTASVGVLEAKEAALRGQIADATDELDILNEAIKEKNTEGARRMGAAEWKEHILQRRTEAKIERKENLLAKFAQFLIDRLPEVKKLWEKFQADHDRQRTKPKEKGHSER